MNYVYLDILKIQKMEGKLNQSQFYVELINFIKKHPYYIANEGYHKDNLEDDTSRLRIDDPDGDFESFIIDIKFIP